MAWRIKLDPGAEKELGKLDAQQAKRILRFLFERVARLDDPRSLGEALHGSRFGTLWKSRLNLSGLLSLSCCQIIVDNLSPLTYNVKCDLVAAKKENIK